MGLRARIRLLLAGRLQPHVGEWTPAPSGSGEELLCRRLKPDGFYEYRKMTPDEEARFLSEDAW